MDRARARFVSRGVQRPRRPPPGLDPDAGPLEVDGGVDVEDVYPGLEDEVQSFLDETGATGVLLSVSAPGRPRVDIAAGLSEPRVPMRADMLFKIGSNTKTFTAAAILLLAEEGALRVEDTLADWVPGYFAEEEQITVERASGTTWEDFVRTRFVEPRLRTSEWRTDTRSTWA
jgi:CubicO group peptidase (beta-lactamase class C family)